MNSTDTFSLFGNLSIEHSLLLMFKGFFIIGGLLYLVFALVIVRQIAIMKKTLTTPISPVVTGLGYLHLILSGLALAFFFLFL